MKQQTAVEWLVDWMGKNQYFIGNDLLQAVEQAKEMEKQQMGKAVSNGISKADMTNNKGYFDFEQYYNETYEK